MNATNRGVNRVVLFIVGIVLVGIGVAAAIAILWPRAGEVWTTGLSVATDWAVTADESSRLADSTTLSWFALAILALLLLVVVLSVTVIARLGGGRSSVMIRDEGSTRGSVTVQHRFASDALSHSLASRAEILSSRVTARRLRGTDILHVSVVSRQNVSPAEVADTVTGLVDGLETLVGRATPTLVSIRAGIRSRVAASQPRVN